MPIRMNKFLLSFLVIIASLGIYTYTNFYSTMKKHKTKYFNKDFVKSPNENRVHYSFFLPNGLEVLLISDEDTKKSAASLDIAVGSGDNPSNRLGLAHYLEHMLFLGTQKYPEADGFQEFISTHGGSYNAYTAHENTNYFFDIKNEYFPAALDRFAAFFIAPTFNQDFAERERNVVDSEFYTGLKNDGRRYYAVLQDILNPEHPMAAFTVGNKETLSGDAYMLIEDLRDFYNKNYHASKMKLVLYSNQSIEKIKSQAHKYFSLINNSEKEKIKSNEPLILPQSLPSLIQFKPIKETRYLDYYFPIPTQIQNYRSKPSEYISHLLNYENQGTLESILKERGWSNGIGANTFLSLPEQALFNIHISLTTAGAKQIKDITSLVFKAIENAQHMSNEKWRYEEIAALRRNWFNFQQEQQALAYVRYLSRAMQILPQERLLSNGLWEQYDKDKIKDIFTQLNPENVMIFFVSPEANTDGGMVEKYYGVPYSFKKLSTSEITEYLNTQATADDKILSPPPNPFISKQIGLIKDESQDKALPSRLPLEEINAWYKFNQSFNAPAVTIDISIKPKNIKNSAKERVYSHLMINLLNDKLSETEYRGSLAGYSYKLNLASYGLNLQIKGYNKKISYWMDDILEIISQPNPTYTQRDFKRIVDNLKRNIKNRAKSSPTGVIHDKFSELMLIYDWSDEDLLEELEGVDMETMEKWTTNYFQEAQLMAYLYGNIKKQTAIKLLNKLNILQPKPLMDLIGRNKLVDINSKGPFIMEVANYQGDSAVQIYYQSAEYGYEERVKTSLLAQLLKPSFFLELRTKQELGYIVQTFYRRDHQRPGISFIVQSNHKHSYEIVKHIDDFIAKSSQLISSMTDEEFDNYKQGLINLIEKPPKNFNEEARLYEQQIAEKIFDFNDREKTIEAMNQLNRNTMVIFTEELLQEKNRLIILSDNLLKPQISQPRGQKVKSTAVLKKQLLNL